MQVAYKDTVTMAKRSAFSTKGSRRIELEPLTIVGTSDVIDKLEEAQPATEKVCCSHMQWNKVAKFLADLFAIELNAMTPGDQKARSNEGLRETESKFYLD